MSTATVKDVIDLGFTAQQFNNPADFDAEDAGYVFRVLDDVGLEVLAEVGAAVYSAANASGTEGEKLNFKRIKNAEMYLAGAALWRRIEGFERMVVVQGRDSGGPESTSSRALKNAQEFSSIAWTEISRITGVEREGRSSFGHIETGHYAKA